MKHTRQLFSALLCLVLVFTSFSLVASAEEIHVDKYHAFVEYFTQTSSGTTLVSSIITYPNDGTLQSKDIDRPISANLIKGEQFRITYANDDTTALFLGERETTVRLENIPLGHIWFEGEQAQYAGITNPEVYTVLVYYADGEMEYVKRTDGDGATISHNPNGRYDVAFTFTPKADVYKIETIVRANYVATDTQGTLEGTLGEFVDTLYQMRVDQDDGTKGLLAGIIEWVKGIYNAIVQGFESIAGSIDDFWNDVITWFDNIWQVINDGFYNMLETITELPYTIRDVFYDLFNELFVPYPDELLMLLEECSEVYLDKFGFLGEIAELIGTFIADCLHSDRIDSITIPEVSIDLPENESFSFGGQTVKVVPDGFADLVNVCKGIVGIMCTFLFINGMRKRYDELMGVEK